MLTYLTEWYSSLDTTLQVFWIAAITASVVFVIQNTLMLIGIGDMDSDIDADTDVDTDHDGTLGSAGIFSMFTLRNFINFFLGFGWGGISLSPAVHNTGLLVLLAFVCGLVFVAVFVVMLRLILRLETNGNFEVSDCVGLTAYVYLRIPAARAAAGKVQVSVNGSVHELNAFTDGAQLPTGSRVRILSVVDGGSLLVEPLVAPAG